MLGIKRDTVLHKIWDFVRKHIMCTYQVLLQWTKTIVHINSIRCPPDILKYIVVPIIFAENITSMLTHNTITSSFLLNEIWYYTTYPVLRGTPAGTNAEADEARTIRDAMDRNFILVLYTIMVGCWMMMTSGKRWKEWRIYWVAGRYPNYSVRSFWVGKQNINHNLPPLHTISNKS